MPSNLNLYYYYGNEAEQCSFYRVPKTILTDPRYKGVSIEAKVLYGLLLDRMSLSARNGWLDHRGRVFLYFTLEDAMAQMGFGHNKAVRHFKELEEIGLIERKKQGQGKPTRIYVKNFILPSEAGQCQRRFKIVGKRRRNFVVFRRGGVIEIECFLAEKEYLRFAASGA